jgi:hypothetical protein
MAGARRGLRCLLLLPVLVASACSNSTTTTAPTAATVPTSTEYFAGTLAPGGSMFYSFSVTTAGETDVTLASTTAAKVGQASSIPLQIGIGSPYGQGCSMVRAIKTTPSLSAQLSNATGVGTYCINVSDSGALAGNVLFAVRIVHP